MTRRPISPIAEQGVYVPPKSWLHNFLNNLDDTSEVLMTTVVVLTIFPFVVVYNRIKSIFN